MLIPLLFCLVAALPQDGAPPTPTTVQGEHFTVVCHFGSERVAHAALEVAEAARPVAMELYGLGPSALTSPMWIQLFDTRADFDAACLRSTGRTWPRNGGLTTSEGGALVLVKRELGPAARARIVLMPNDRHLIAHETTHLVGMHGSSGYASHPPWVSEGLAEVVAERVSIQADDARREPAVSTRAYLVQNLVRTGALPDVTRLFTDGLPAFDTPETYAVYGATMRWLLEGAHADALLGVLRAGALDPTKKRFNPMFAAALGKLQRDELTRSFHAAVMKSEPLWSIGHGHLIQRTPQSWLQVARDNHDAFAWRWPQVRGVDYTLDGKFEIAADTPDAQMLVLVARAFLEGPVTEYEWIEFYYSVSLGRTQVELTQHVSGSEKGEYFSAVHTQALNAHLELEPGRTYAFGITVGHRKLSVTIDGESVLQHAFEEDVALVGQWGVGVDAGHMGTWSELRARTR